MITKIKLCHCDNNSILKQKYKRKAHNHLRSPLIKWYLISSNCYPLFL